MKERGVIFAAPMVRAILDGWKTVTRRIVSEQDAARMGLALFGIAARIAPDIPAEPIFIPPEARRYWPGLRLWVRETWGGDNCCGVAYRADHPDWPRFLGDGEQSDGPWRSPIHMPRWASRITLEVVDVRVELLHDITEEDAVREGVDGPGPGIILPPHARAGELGFSAFNCGTFATAREAFAFGWNVINGKRAPWDSNPWVWRVEFRKVTP